MSEEIEQKNAHAPVKKLKTLMVMLAINLR